MMSARSPSDVTGGKSAIVAAIWVVRLKDACQVDTKRAFEGLEIVRPRLGYGSFSRRDSGTCHENSLGTMSRPGDLEAVFNALQATPLLPLLTPSGPRTRTRGINRFVGERRFD